MRKQDYLAELKANLPVSCKRDRLLEELDAHMEDAEYEAAVSGEADVEAENVVMNRVGSTHLIADHMKKYLGPWQYLKILVFASIIGYLNLSLLQVVWRLLNSTYTYVSYHTGPALDSDVFYQFGFDLLVVHNIFVALAYRRLIWSSKSVVYRYLPLFLAITPFLIGKLLSPDRYFILHQYPYLTNPPMIETLEPHQLLMLILCIIISSVVWFYYISMKPRVTAPPKIQADPTFAKRLVKMILQVLAIPFFVYLFVWVIPLIQIIQRQIDSLSGDRLTQSDFIFLMGMTLTIALVTSLVSVTRQFARRLNHAPFQLPWPSLIVIGYCSLILLYPAPSTQITTVANWRVPVREITEQLERKRYGLLYHFAKYVETNSMDSSLRIGEQRSGLRIMAAAGWEATLSDIKNLEDYMIFDKKMADPANKMSERIPVSYGVACDNTSDSYDRLVVPKGDRTVHTRPTITDDFTWECDRLSYRDKLLVTWPKPTYVNNISITPDAKWALIHVQSDLFLADLRDLQFEEPQDVQTL